MFQSAAFRYIYQKKYTYVCFIFILCRTIMIILWIVAVFQFKFYKFFTNNRKACPIKTRLLSKTTLNCISRCFCLCAQACFVFMVLTKVNFELRSSNIEWYFCWANTNIHITMLSRANKIKKNQRKRNEMKWKDWGCGINQL